MGLGYLEKEDSKLFEIIPLIRIYKMNKMHISETPKFAVRLFLPPTLVVILIFLITILAFPTFSLTFEEFTLIYWSLSIVALPLNYKVMKWTAYVIEHYGLEKEKNPVMRKMYATKNFKERRIALIGIYIMLFIWYIIGVNAQVFFLFLILPPSWVLAIVLYDFLNDFLWLRKLKKTNKKI
jgi:hypothetical protein